MSRWKHAWSATVGGAGVIAVWAVVALTAPAQNPGAPSPFAFPSIDGSGQEKQPEPLPPLQVPDENVQQAQLKQRAPGAPDQPPRADLNVRDPAYPVVTIRVRVPADAQPGDDIKYVITVQNTSTADAHAVTVRNPLAAEVEKPVDFEPKPASVTDKQLVWTLGTLKAGASRTITLTLRHKPNVGELKNLAYVQFEHGQLVTTKIGNPTVKVSKVAPKQTVRDEPYAVRVLVENTGRLPAQNVRVVENLPASAQMEPVTAGAKQIQQPAGQPQQWEWEIAKLQPGERRVLEYKVIPREAKDVILTTNVAGPKVAASRTAEARTEVLVPGLDVKLTGPEGVVNAGEPAMYSIVVRNTGTLPSTNLKVTGTIPSDCKPTKKTDGGQIYRDSIVWQLPRLEPGESYLFRYGLKANTTGRRVVTASAVDARSTRASQELATTFSGTAALVWETTFDSLTAQVGKQRVFTVRVRNTGGEVARNVRVRIDVPDSVSVVQTTPKRPVEDNAILFAADSIPGYGESTYTLTFQGKKADQAWFRVRMAADSLGDRPMQTEKMVEVIGNPK